MILLYFMLCSAQESTFIDGFVTFNFTYEGVRASFFSNLSIKIRNLKGSLIDQVEVQPSGYWISDATLPSEISIQIESPDGVNFENRNFTVRAPYDHSIDFVITGFDISGQILCVSEIGQINITNETNSTDQNSTQNITNKENSPLFVPVTVDLINIQEKTKISNQTNQSYFCFSNLKPGRYRIRLPNITFRSKVIEITANPLTDVKLEVDSWEPHGVVIFPQNVTIPSIVLNLDSWRFSTQINVDSTGHFKLANVPKGDYILSCKHPKFKISSANITINENALTNLIELHYLGTHISGIVYLTNKEPCKNALVKLIELDISCYTDNHGRFTLENVIPIRLPTIKVFYPFWIFSIPIIQTIGTNPPRDLTITATHGPISGNSDCLDYNVSVSSDPDNILEIHNGSFTIIAPLNNPVLVSISSECKLDSDAFLVQSPKNIEFYTKHSKVKGFVGVIVGDYDTPTVVLSGKHNYSTKVKSTGSVNFDSVPPGYYDISIESDNNTFYELNITNVTIVNESQFIGVVANFGHHQYRLYSHYNMSIFTAPNTITHLTKGWNTVQTKVYSIIPTDCYNFESFKPVDNIVINVTEVIRKVVIFGNSKIAQSEIKVNGEKLEEPYRFIQKVGEIPKIECFVRKPFIVENPVVYADFPHNCSQSVIYFEIKYKTEIEGNIIPAVENVNVSLYSQGKFLGTALSDGTGHYKIYNVTSLQALELKAFKDSYKFEQRKGSFDFDSRKLSTIFVNFSMPVDGALISISSINGFHDIKTITNSSAKFENLENDEYYIKPILKEFEFEPLHHRVFVANGNDSFINFVAFKNRFSISGFVNDIYNKGVENVELTITDKNGITNQIKSVKSGKYTFSNMKSNNGYKITASETENYKITPNSVTVNISRENVENVNFKTIPLKKRIDLVGEIYHSDIEISDVLVSISDENKVLQTHEFKSSLPIFFFTDVPERKITLRVMTKSIQGRSSICHESSFVPHNSIEQISIACRNEEEIQTPDVISSPLEATFATSFLFFTLILLLNFKRFMSLINHFIK